MFRQRQFAATFNPALLCCIKTRDVNAVRNHFRMGGGGDTPTDESVCQLSRHDRNRISESVGQPEQPFPISTIPFIADGRNDCGNAIDPPENSSGHDSMEHEANQYPGSERPNIPCRTKWAKVLGDARTRVQRDCPHTDRLEVRRSGSQGEWKKRKYAYFAAPVSQAARDLNKLVLGPSSFEATDYKHRLGSHSLRLMLKRIPDYVPSSPCDCWPPETGVQAAPNPRFRPLGRRLSVSDELSRTIAFRVRSADELGT